MNIIVPRTCTEIGDDGAEAGTARSAGGFADTKHSVWDENKREAASARATGGFDSGWEDPDEAEGAPGDSGRSMPLEAFRESAAYVLLGAPGAGKTEVFKAEGKRDGCHYVTAREFLTFDIDDTPEWHDTTLFIDGLDERRAGAADGRTPLDAIRARLDALGRPGFRLSCREADWFGANDRSHLARVSRDGAIKVLRLDPLSGDDIREILTRNLGIEDATAFVATAHERGLDALLANPQNLEMLAKAVQGGTWPDTRKETSRGGAWPETRKETFELACKRLVREHNPERRLASRDAPPPSELLSAAERLCAVQLLTGRAGYVLPGGESDGDHLELDDVSGDRSQKRTLCLALGTRLFKSSAESCLVPAHRQIAEFLAARHLAKSIDAGLPVRRVLALMTGGDGGVVSELRGLSAWLAAHSKASRAEIVERDPLGTILYGDVRGFSSDEKRQVLDSLERETERNPWSRNTVGLDPRLGGLAAADMEEVFRDHLRDARRDDAGQRFTSFLLGSLIHGQPIPMVAGLLMEIARDDSRWSGVRRLALDAFIRHRGRDAGTVELKALLADVRAGVVSDPDNAALRRVFAERLAVLEGYDAEDARHRQEDEALDEAWARKRQQERREWREAVTSQQASLREGRGDPALLEQLALVWFGGYVGVEGDTPEARLRSLLGDDDLPGDDDPIQVVMDAFRGTVGRPDIPDPPEIVRLHSERRRHRLAFPFLAGMEVLAPATRAERTERDETCIRQAFAFHYTTSPADRSPDWYEPLLASHPGIAADVLIELTRTEMRSGKQQFSGIYKLEDSVAVARLASLPLLDAFPVRCAAERLDDLSCLLRTALLHCDVADVLKAIERKLARRSMGTAQRVCWLAAGLLASATSAFASSGSAASYRERLEEYVSGNERRTRHLADFLSRGGDAPFSTLSWRLDVSALQLLVRLIGSVHRPALGPLDSMSDLVRGLTDRIASVSTPEATGALAALRDDDALRPWRPELVDAAHRQGAVRRDAEFRHPGAARVLETLAGRGPSNAADLAALTVDLLEEISRNIRDGNTNDWRQYWIQAGGDQPWRPGHEDDCRNALLSDLRYRMRGLGIEAEPEGRYAGRKRADIRVSHGGFNVPVEIKKSTSRDLWSAIRNQLIAKYTRDPGATGYGIYLVFWLGNEPELCQMPESGPRPKSAAALEERLRDTLSPEEARLISVRVIDIARPATCLAEGAAKRP